MKASESQGIVILVGGGQLPEILRAVERRGLRAIALTFRELIATPLEDPVILSHEVIDVASTLVAVRRLVELHAQHDVRAIVPVGEYGLLAAAVAAIKLGLPGPSLPAVTATRDKLRMRRAVDRAGLPQPRWASCDNVAEAANFLRSEGAPIVVKPAWGSGSEAVSLVATERALEEAFGRIRASLPAGPVLCEQFVDGPEVSLEACTVDGRFVALALTDKRTGDDFVETGHQQPSTHSTAVQQEVFAVAEKILATLGVDQTVSHSEFRLSADGPMLIETHTRMGGDWIHALTAEAHGVDLADLTVGLALGEQPSPASRLTGRGCAIRYLTGAGGRLLAIAAPPAGPEILRTHVRAQPGDLIDGCRSSLDRLAEVIATGNDAADAAANAERHLERIEVRWAAEAAHQKAS